jgi:hypothetical protein
MSLIRPKFRRYSGGTLIMGYSRVAEMLKVKGTGSDRISVDPKQVHQNAVQMVIRLDGDRKDKLTVLGQYILQFGAFRGQSFKWMLENGLGYAGYLVDDLIKSKEVKNASPLSMSKFAFKEYVLGFDEGKEAVEMKKMGREPKSSCTVTSTGSTPPSVSSLMVGRKLSPAALKAKIHQTLKKVKPNIPGE